MSTFNVITPITITDAILTGSNVPEADLQEFVAGTAYAVGDTVMVATSTANIHKTYECLVAQSAGITADLLDENCSDISDWTLYGDTAEVSPTGQFKFHRVTHGVGGSASCYRSSGSIPNKFSLEIKTYFNAIGTLSDNDYFNFTYANGTWVFDVSFCSDGLYIRKAGSATTEVGTNIVKCNDSAAWQYWRFQVDKTTESAATVTVYLKEEGGEWTQQGAAVDCDLESIGSSTMWCQQKANTTDNRITHIDYIKIATVSGTVWEITNTSDTPAGNSNWLELESTNRWKTFNSVLGSQTEQATKIEYVLTPGAVIDSVALLNIESDTVDIVEIDTADALLNESAWTGATGTTQTTGWNKVGTPSDYTIDGGMIKITADGASEGQSKTIAVTAGVEYQLLGLYKNTSGDVAQIGIYDNTNAADIVATTDFDSKTANASFSQVFTAPVGCTSIEVKQMAKAAGDIVWFDSFILAPTEYSETVTTGASKTSVIKTDIPQKATGILTVTINKSGTAAIGELKIGTKTSLGTMRPKPQIGFRNLSTLDEDTFGNIDIVSRGYKQKLICGITITNTSLDTVYKFLCDHKDDMMVYVGSESYSCLQLYGFSKEPQIVVGQNISDMSLEIWSVI